MAADHGSEITIGDEQKDRSRWLPPLGFPPGTVIPPLLAKNRKNFAALDDVALEVIQAPFKQASRKLHEVMPMATIT